MRFTKMQGAGNDYVYVDCFSQPVPNNLPALARQIAHRHFGVGGDGLILIRPSEVADVRMHMFNADGSEGMMCGNGVRCVAKYAFDHELAPKRSMSVETASGVLSLDVSVGSDGLVDAVTVDMGEPILEPARIPTTLGSSPDPIVDQPCSFGDQQVKVTCVSMGNPHCVVFVEEATDELVLGLGPIIESDPRFPDRVNVEFVQRIGGDEVRQRTWERGSGETWACGTGASAVCVAGVLTGRTERRITNHLLGGDLILQWDESTNHVMMTGGATEVFSGEWSCVESIAQAASG
ncbi:MAG: diaminopimelate epimerase [Planctomycetota bacterium]